MMDHSRYEARQEALETAKRMQDARLVAGSAGNVSLRLPSEPNIVAITPTSIPYSSMKADEIVLIDVGSGEQIEPGPRASSELPTHLAIYRARKDVGGIVHTHSPWVSVLSLLRKPLPPVIDEMAVYFGGEIAVAPYAFTGTPDLGENVVRTLGDRNGVILSNHGNICVGATAEEALQIAIRMEATAEIYVNALRIGEPVPLSQDAIQRGLELYEARKRSREQS